MMNMKKLIVAALALLVCGTAAAQEKAGYGKKEKVEKAYRYRVYFSDKDNGPYSLKRPEEFLSAKALERRRKFRIKPDEHDIPVTPVYLEYLRRKGMRVLHTSRWNNTAVVQVADTALMDSLKGVTFVKGTRRVWESPDMVEQQMQVDRNLILTNLLDTIPGSLYGHGQRQASMIAADSLHARGFRGEGVTIAVVDGGFQNVDKAVAFKGCRIAGMKNFSGNGTDNVCETQADHGTMVLACMAANLPGTLVGTAPDATYYLLQSEDVATEHIVEEDNWCAALEYADSVGADIVTSSLGYTEFDDRSASHRYAELDGHTAINSCSASMAASRGLIVLNSAGNSGDNTWKKIGTPADAENILTVGAVKENGINTVFSSLGNTADGRVKPDVMAMGQDTWLIDAMGNVTQASGTSFSCPVMAGGVACLVQACPDKRPEEVIEAVRNAGNNVRNPDNVYGYGIPNLMEALRLLQND